MKGNIKYLLIIMAIITIVSGCNLNREIVEWDRTFFNNEVSNKNWSFSRVELKVSDNLQSTTYSLLTYIGEEDIDVANIDIKFYLPDDSLEQNNIEVLVSSIKFEDINDPNYLETLEKGIIVGTSGLTSSYKDLGDIEINKMIIEIIYEVNGELKKELFEVGLKEL